jgi:hypothetical protein
MEVVVSHCHVRNHLLATAKWKKMKSCVSKASQLQHKNDLQTFLPL